MQFTRDMRLRDQDVGYWRFYWYYAMNHTIQVSRSISIVMQGLHECLNYCVHVCIYIYIYCHNGPSVLYCVVLQWKRFTIRAFESPKCIKHL
jgi:hypothetical protein